MNLPFTISSMENFDKFITNYKGLDLSFLSLNVSRYIDQWAMPTTRRTTEDREVTITYNFPDIKMVNDTLSYLYLYSDQLYLQSKANKNCQAKARFISSSINEFSQKIELNVRLLVESGFILRTSKVGNFDYQRWEGRNLLPVVGTVDWKIDIKPNTISRPAEISYKLYPDGNTAGSYTQSFIISIPKYNGAALCFNTKDMNGSTYGDMSFAEAVAKGDITLKGEPLPDFDGDKVTSVALIRFNTNIDAAPLWTIRTRYLVI